MLPMRKFVAVAILVPLAVIIVMFAVANREIITVSFDPFDSAHPALALQAAAVHPDLRRWWASACVVGGIAAWLKQHKWRMRARRAEAEARELRARLDAEPPRRNVPARTGARAAVRRSAGGVTDPRVMRIVTADDIDRVLSYRGADRCAGRGVPRRHRSARQDRAYHPAAVRRRRQGDADAGLDHRQSGERFIGCKLVNVFPDNARRNKPSVLRAPMC